VLCPPRYTAAPPECRAPAGPGSSGADRRHLPPGRHAAGPRRPPALSPPGRYRRRHGAAATHLRSLRPRGSPDAGRPPTRPVGITRRRWALWALSAHGPAPTARSITPCGGRAVRYPPPCSLATGGRGHRRRRASPAGAALATGGAAGAGGAAARLTVAAERGEGDPAAADDGGGVPSPPLPRPASSPGWV
jgi:hypothetical protein